MIARVSPKTASAPKGVDLATLDLAAALKRLALPRLVGMHPVDGLPIEANFVGKKIKTNDNEVVEVKLTEIDGEDAIYVMEKI